MRLFFFAALCMQHDARVSLAWHAASASLKDPPSLKLGPHMAKKKTPSKKKPAAKKAVKRAAPKRAAKQKAAPKRAASKAPPRKKKTSSRAHTRPTAPSSRQQPVPPGSEQSGQFVGGEDGHGPMHIPSHRPVPAYAGMHKNDWAGKPPTHNIPIPKR